jgi:hypothetical protein
MCPRADLDVMEERNIPISGGNRNTVIQSEGSWFTKTSKLQINIRAQPVQFKNKQKISVEESYFL